MTLGAPVVELHTGRYCELEGAAPEAPSSRGCEGARRSCARLGLECHVGHGLSYADVGPVAAIPEVRELNIGHFLVGEAIFVGLEPAIREMRRVMDEARRQEPRVILGIGNDLCDISRIEKSLERFGDRFVQRIFTEIEQKRSEGRATRAASYAKRFAAKEACAKALGTGLRRGVFWRDMGVINHARRQAHHGADRRRAGAPAGDHAGRNDAADRPDPDRRISAGAGDRDHFCRTPFMSRDMREGGPRNLHAPMPRRQRETALCALL